MQIKLFAADIIGLSSWIRRVSFILQWVSDRPFAKTFLIQELKPTLNDVSSQSFICISLHLFCTQIFFSAFVSNLNLVATCIINGHFWRCM